MKSLLVITVGLLTMFFSGCAMKHSNATDQTSQVPKNEDSFHYEKLVQAKDSDVSHTLKKCLAYVTANQKIPRMNSMDRAIQSMYKKARPTSDFRSSFVRQELHREKAKMMRYAGVQIEPSEVVSIDETLDNPQYKKVMVALEETDIESGCKNGLLKLATGFEKRYLYFGAVKSDRGWKLYVDSPQGKPTTMFASSGGNRCSKYVTGSEAHAEMLAILIRSEFDKLK